LERNEHFFFSDDDDLFRFADKPTMGSFLEFFTGINGGYDDGDIFRGNVGGVFGKRDRTVGEGGNDTE
jgi:hypothetical protein